MRFSNYSFPVRAPYYLDPEGKVIEAIWNEGTKHPQVKYYYSSAQECMKNNILSFQIKVWFEFCLPKVFYERASLSSSARAI